MGRGAIADTEIITSHHSARTDSTYSRSMTARTVRAAHAEGQVERQPKRHRTAARSGVLAAGLAGLALVASGCGGDTDAGRGALGVTVLGAGAAVIWLSALVMAAR